MGHHTVSRIVNLSDIKPGSSALHIAEERWIDEERGRYDNAGFGPSPAYPLMTADAAFRSLDTNVIRVDSGQSALVPLCDAKDVVQKTVQRKISVTGAQLASLRSSAYSFFPLDLARARFGMSVVAATVHKLPAPRKAAATATDGKAATRYEVVAGEATRVGELHNSQSEARTAAIAIINSSTKYSRLSVRAVIVREGGTRDLVVIERPEPEAAEVTVNVTTSEPKAGAKQVAWLAAFDVHS